jgi:hypothetical protein
LTCGEGTIERDGQCVVAEATPDPVNTGGSSGTGGSGTITGGSTGTGEAGGTGGSAGGPILPPGATSDEVGEADVLCRLAEDGASSITTLVELRAHFVGRWLHCAGPVIFGREDAAGLRIDADGTFRFLFEEPDAGLVDGVGFDNVGVWSVIDVSDVNGDGPNAFQVNLDIPGIGGNAVFPVFATAPPKMRLATMLGPSDYAALGER